MYSVTITITVKSAFHSFTINPNPIYECNITNQTEIWLFSIKYLYHSKLLPVGKQIHSFEKSNSIKAV